MNDLIKLTALELADKLAAGEVTSVEVTQAFLDRIHAVDGRVHAFLYVDDEGALAAARAVDEDRAAGKSLSRLAGVPIAVKDNMVTRGVPTTAASHILQGWLPPYDATVVLKLKAAGMPILGKTNLDEFAMGSSTEHSAFGPTHNPWDLSRIPGGSGGGSAAAVGAFEAPLALGSDTGGSIRQPAAVTGTVGMKPTYGVVSRYGLIAMGSSLDQIGPVTRNIADAAALLEVIAGHDVHDATSLPDDVPAFSQTVADALAADPNAAPLSGVRVGVIDQLAGDGYQQGVLDSFGAALDVLVSLGADIVHISAPSFTYALAAYYLIMPAEVSSNLARYDGIRYGLRVEPKEGPITSETVMAATREAGFGLEAKRRIILGTYVLSSGYYDAYYASAQKVRTLVQRDFASAFTKADVLVSPTAPTVAFPLGEKISDPMAMYVNDIATIPANLAGVPALSLPSGLSDGLPVGFQILAPAQQDARLYHVGAIMERALGAPLTDASPALEWEE